MSFSVSSTITPQWRPTKQPSLAAKTVTPHVLRHTCAMDLLRHGVDTSVIPLWLGHEAVQTTQIYLHADLSLKERALALTTPPTTRVGRYRPVGRQNVTRANQRC
jgi:integrase